MLKQNPKKILQLLHSKNYTLNNGHKTKTSSQRLMILGLSIDNYYLANILLLDRRKDVGYIYDHRRSNGRPSRRVARIL